MGLQIEEGLYLWVNLISLILNIYVEFYCFQKQNRILNP